MKSSIKVIDLFAGPGGLGEGFSSFQSDKNYYPFSIVASVEKEASAHKTLTLRAFYRQFRGREVPEDYYAYLRSDGSESAESFFSNKFPKEWETAKTETLGGPKALGSDDHDDIFKKIKIAIKGHNGPKVVVGGPPCQAYSLVGRSRNKGNAGYSAEEDHRHFLYQEYLKVLDLVQPDIFVMENVKGILTAKVNGESIFEKIRKDLTCPALALKSGGKEIEYELLPFAHPISDRSTGFKNKDFVIRTEEFGIPQARHRVILLGVRKRLLNGIEDGVILSRWQSDNKVSVEQVLADLPPLRSGLTKTKFNDAKAWQENLELGVKKLSKVFKSKTNAEKLARSTLDAAASDFDQGGRFVRHKKSDISAMPAILRKWYLDKRLGGVLNHQARNHMPEDLHRYLFAICFAGTNDGVSPRAMDYPVSLAPNHQNWESGNFCDRFKVQARNRVASTVTSHISKDGHYFIHFDAKQCRSLTVREAARIQTFPDNYFFEGNRTEQYVQVGNAVPPLFATYIAEIVYEILK
ncbi:MAG: DNA (cytosine-5-)-methyltransferase [Pseudohongiella sp.]|nr:DNA (cytosine-5-)-methyltransferase [Pseudohongiella sp.]